MPRICALDSGAGGRRHGGQVLGDRFTLVPDHDHDIRDVRRVYGPQYVPEQGFTGYFMQHFGFGRVHGCRDRQPERQQLDESHDGL